VVRASPRSREPHEDDDAADDWDEEYNKDTMRLTTKLLTARVR
jgi:hypothetical protein